MGKSMSILSPCYSVEKKFPIEESYSPVYISPIAHDGSVVLSSSARTLFESFMLSTEIYAKNPFLGTRALRPNGSLGPYIWKSYSEVLRLTQLFTSGLKRLKLLPKDLSAIGIYAKNREEMVLLELVCMSQNITIIPLSDALSTETLTSVLTQSKPNFIACGKAQFDTLISLKKNCLSPIRTVLMFDVVRESVRLQSRSLGLDMHEFNEIMQLGTENNDFLPPTPDSVYCISYTSGITGEPKGAMITHRNAIATLLAVGKAEYAFLQDDSYLMYLPHSHIFDRVMFHILLNVGAKIGFYSGDIMNIKDDLEQLRPTIFMSVPRLFNRFYQIILQRFQNKKGLSKKLLNSSLEKKRVKYDKSGNVKNGFLQKFVFKKVRNSLGGRVRMMVSGSAPLSGEVLKFLRIVFACPIIEGYGLTETCGATFLTGLNDIMTDHIGGPLPGIEVKLREIPEMGYFCKGEVPTGELCVRGPTVFIGYFDGQELTDKTMDSDGWFYTGDIISRNSSDGSFKVLDRLNNIIKLSQGEYVSLEKIEKVLNSSKFVHQIFVHGDPLQHFLVAIVVPCKDYIQKKWALQSPSSEEWSQIVKSPKLKNEISENFKEISLQSQLNRYELVNKIYLEEEEWTDQDLLTPTQKLSRVKAKLKYAERLQQLYSD